MLCGICSCLFIPRRNWTKLSTVLPMRISSAICWYLRLACGSCALNWITFGKYIALAAPWIICAPWSVNAAPVLCAMECTIPSSPFVKAIPAMHCASCMLALYCMFPLNEPIKSRWIILIECRASPSLYAEFAVETYASTEWVIASIPVCATSFLGIVSANAGSTIATSGVISKSAIGYLIPLL